MSLIDYYNKNTKILTIPNTFNRKLNDIPKETEIIIFSEDDSWSGRSYFNQPVNNLPETLTHLTFGRQTPVRLAHPKIMNIHNCLRCHNFNQSVDNLPNSLTHLTFGNSFNQPVDNLPETLTHLTFGYNFNQSVDNLPNSLTHLTFGARFNQQVDNLPNTLTHLTFGHDFNQQVDNLPKNLTHLTFCGNYGGTLINQLIICHYL
jgi:hypothetical protein